MSFLFSLRPPARLTAYQVNINISHVDGAGDTTTEDRPSRSASVASALDSYYFGIGSPSESPVPPASSASTHLSVTPDHPFLSEPQTPARNIDRRGLVGVGELATPRWSRGDNSYYQVTPEEAENYQPNTPAGQEERADAPDSPWTIEAIDGEGSGKEEEVQSSGRSQPACKADYENNSQLHSNLPHAPFGRVHPLLMKVVAKKSSIPENKRDHRPSYPCSPAKPSRQSHRPHQTSIPPQAHSTPPRARQESGHPMSLSSIRQAPWFRSVPRRLRQRTRPKKISRHRRGNIGA